MKLQQGTLQELKELFSQINLSFNYQESQLQDGRIASIVDEPKVIDALKQKADAFGFEVFESDNKRDWFDIKIIYHGKIFYVNIKITTGSAYDNVSSKKGFYYYMTGSDSAPSKFEDFNAHITQNFPAHNADYFFLVVFKQDKSFLISSIGNLKEPRKNGNNLPFQVNWGIERELDDRIVMSRRQQQRKLLNIYIDGFIQRCQGLNSLLEWRENEKQRIRTILDARSNRAKNDFANRKWQKYSGSLFRNGRFFLKD